jgi:hypothetical protein
VEATKATILYHHHHHDQSYPLILSLKMQILLVLNNLDSGPLIYIKYLPPSLTVTFPKPGQIAFAWAFGRAGWSVRGHESRLA